MTDVSFADLASKTILASVIPSLLARHGHAIVLERIARGGGATRWSALRQPQDLESLGRRLSPGGRVSFYFDERLSTRPYDRDVAAEILRIARHDGDAVVGQVGTDKLEIEVDFIAGSRS